MTQKKQEHEKNNFLLELAKERVSGLLERYPHGLYVEKVSIAYKMSYGEELVPQAFGFPCLEKMLQSLQDTVQIKVKELKEMKWILYIKTNIKNGKYINCYLVYVLQKYILLNHVICFFIKS